MNSLFVKVVLSLFTIMWSFITVMLIPYVYSRITDSQMDKLSWFVTCAVRCAEQIYTTEQWRQKKEYVMERVLKYVNDTLHLTLDESDVDVIVEGIVNEIKH